MASLKGKVVRVDVYKIGTSNLLRSVIGKCKSIHTARGIRDSSYVQLIDSNGIRIPTIKDNLSEYEVVMGEVY